MKQMGLFLGFLALLIVVLPALNAQDGKKKGAVAEKAEKKDGADKEDKTEPEKKKPEPKKAPEKLVYGNKFITKIISANAASNQEYTVEIQERDPKKVYDWQVWQAQQQVSLQRQLFSLSQQKVTNASQLQSYQNAQFNYQRALVTFQMENVKRSQNIYTPKPLDVRMAENVKVRAMTPPIEFDDQGFEKKWTKKELAARRDKTGLPGFAVDLDALKTGQYVELYMAKVAPPAKGPKKKRNPDDEPPPGAADRPEVVMVVILPEWKK